ncbi:hypothetical protein B296_00013681 [Ensete ventricosum]|uniref:Uncharacterized protein n=1 Tax=Ensete ventricosum TaxID=4639 RepID=A0A427B867_ENSVE|nr:hypothetical protein B296_00013681 [Ensete ventricosum]
MAGNNRPRSNHPTTSPENRGSGSGRPAPSYRLTNGGNQNTTNSRIATARTNVVTQRGRAIRPIERQREQPSQALPSSPQSASPPPRASSNTPIAAKKDENSRARPRLGLSAKG